MSHTATTIRGVLADGAGGERIDRLAAVAGRRAPEGPMLRAEAQDEPVAAIGIFDRHTIADPGRVTVPLRLRLHLLRLGLRLIVAVRGL